MTTEELRKATIDIVVRFQRAVCRCGKGKLRRMAFCKECYYSLPKDMQSALWRNWNEGFIPAYLDAEEYLVKTKTEATC